MNNIPKDIYYNLFENLSLQDIINLCNTNRSFKNFCLDNQTFIAKTKCTSVQKFINDNESSIREFAIKHKMCFDNKSRDEIIRLQGSCSVQNKFTIDLLYLVNNGLYDEAYILITCSKNVPEPEGSWIFTSKLFDAFPSYMVDVYLKRLPPILDLMGYDNAEDFYSDYSLNQFTNSALRKYIEKI